MKQLSWLAAVIGCFLLICAFVFWHALREHETSQILYMMNSELSELDHHIQKIMVERALALQRMAHRWATQGKPVQRYWETDALNYFWDQPGYQAIAWANPISKIEWIVPREGNEAALHQKIWVEAPAPLVYGESAQTRLRQIGVTPFMNLPQGGKGFLILVPIYHEHDFQGHVVGIFNIQDLMNSVLGNGMLEKYAIDILDGPEKVFASQLERTVETGKYVSHERQIPILNQVWHFRFYPYADTIGTMRSLIPTIALIVGLIFSLLVASLLYLLRVVQYRKSRVEKIVEHRTQELKNEINARTLAEDNLHKIIEAIPDALLGINQDGKIVFANNSVKSVFGYSIQDIEQRVVEDLIPHRFRDSHVAKRSAYFQSPYVRTLGTIQNLFALRHDGEEIPVEVGLSPLKTTDGMQVLCLVRDITDRKHLEDLKNEFISTVSHELRTPMAIIKEAVATLKSGIPCEPHPEQVHVLSLANNNCERLTRIINTLLDMSHLESGKVQPRPVWFRLSDLITELLENTRPTTQKRNISVQTTLSDETLDVFADKDMIMRVLTNLLDNALRYSRSHIAIHTMLIEDHLFVCIQDDGPGVPKHELPRLFNKFEQLRRVESGDVYKGVGLGLHISKNIIAMHRGDMWVENNIDVGMRICFSLPQIKAS